MEKCIALVDGIRCNRNQKNSTNPNCDAHYRHLRKWGEYREIGNMGPRGVLSMRDPTGRKQCRRCLEWKTIDSFHNSPSSPDALQSLCKLCSNVTVLNSYYNAGGYNPEKKMKESSLAKAIADAHKKSVAENTIQAYTEVVRQCQRETSQLQTVPFMRSDSQQAHCYRY